MGHQFLSRSQGVGRSIFSDPGGVGHPISRNSIYAAFKPMCNLFLFLKKHLYKLKVTRKPRFCLFIAY